MNCLATMEMPAVMGVINVSPNSFYRPVTDVGLALRAADQMVTDGAAIIDVGGEATNPRVVIARDRPSPQEELDRVLPVIEAISQRFDVLLSVDTSRPSVMREAIKQGAGMINDQRLLTEPDALATVADLKVPVCLMHCFSSPRQPGSMGFKPLLLDIKRTLSSAVSHCEMAGISRDHLFIDPGFGQGNYGKSCEENYYLLEHLDCFQSLNLPILVAWSRKSMLADVLDNAAPSDRLYGSIAAAVIALMRGASVIRTHDVKPTMDAVNVFKATKQFL